MKSKKLFALVLAAAMLLPMLFACAPAKKGDPYTVANVTVVSYVDPNFIAQETEELTGTETKDKTPAAKPEAYEEELFSGEVIVYSETEEFTLKDVVMAYCEDNNSDYYFDKAQNRFTKIDGIAAGSGYYWFYKLNGADVGLDKVIKIKEGKVEDSIEIYFSK